MGKRQRGGCCTHRGAAERHKHKQGLDETGGVYIALGLDSSKENVYLSLFGAPSMRQPAASRVEGTYRDEEEEEEYSTSSFLLIS